MAIIDDVIGVFSPGWKAARLRSRALIMAYEAVKPTRTHKARRENRSADQLSKIRCGFPAGAGPFSGYQS
ncbi:head-tail preconnector protein [Escherichia coli]|nr:head-tail preconnector protein [Escherichia coli]